MDWSASTWWWIAAGVLVAGELATGTFYVLMLAIGCAFGALAGYAQISFLAQAAVAAAVGGAAVLAWDRTRKRDPARLAPAANRDINLDIGEQVQVDGWNADGTARVPYRGSSWNVRYIGDGPAAPGPHVIAEVRHNELALRRA
jgi:membrane protein implicated in regulation of membrane protease activity